MDTVLTNSIFKSFLTFQNGSKDKLLINLRTCFFDFREGVVSVFDISEVVKHIFGVFGGFIFLFDFRYYEMLCIVCVTELGSTIKSELT